MKPFETLDRYLPTRAIDASELWVNLFPSKSFTLTKPDSGLER